MTIKPKKDIPAAQEPRNSLAEHRPSHRNLRNYF